MALEIWTSGRPSISDMVFLSSCTHKSQATFLTQHKITEYAVSIFVRKPEKQQQYEHNTYQISIIGIFSVFPHYDNNTHRLHNTIPIEYLTFSGQPDSNNNNNNFRLLYKFCFNWLQQAWYILIRTRSSTSHLDVPVYASNDFQSNHVFTSPLGTYKCTNGWPMGEMVGPCRLWHEMMWMSVGRYFSKAAFSGAFTEVWPATIVDSLVAGGVKVI